MLGEGKGNLKRAFFAFFLFNLLIIGMLTFIAYAKSEVPVNLFLRYCRYLVDNKQIDWLKKRAIIYLAYNQLVDCFNRESSGLAEAAANV